ncbi:MAG: bifunctional diaminohydroxyphosphoribosylaminopyrimidine deaminase/5-amino-6-(5-phosphoribosylamino)uracil reductase RibD [Weeksellaceae bacterium]|nr:bifunctional diaminohydroxyphosphoribosylaminopyrimidine deaminase/5-amino-6-(5-phosphoribosylamino)uracil reductase RibD [Weeksellaceae bacterium]
MPSTHIEYMRRCLQLASNGLGNTYPNPLVGSVIVHNNRIIGEGWHKRAGERHAEIVAINQVQEISLLKESTLYVNLEPCSHYGRTPPCAHSIVDMKIPRVVIGCRDIAAHVNGKGIAYLQEKGVDVVEGILQEEAQHLNRRFFTYQGKKRPYIILKWAQTSNGFMATKSGEKKWISGKEAKQLVHKWRTEEQAILVGSGTVEIDNPQLNARLWVGNNPQIVILSTRISGFPGAHINEASPIIFPGDGTKAISENLNELMEVLHAKNVQSMIVEGGSKVLRQFIEQGLWDEMRVITGDTIWQDGIYAPEVDANFLVQEKMLGKDILRYYVKN